MRTEKGSGIEAVLLSIAVHLLPLTVVLLVGCHDQRGMAELRAGYAALEAKNYGEAMQAAQAVSSARSSPARVAHAHHLKGRVLEQRPKKDEGTRIRELTEAKEEYAAALAAGPDEELEANIRTSLGNTLYWLDDFAQAEAEWQKAIPLLEGSPMQAWVMYRVGVCQQRQGKWNEAEETYAQVIRRFPGTEAASRAAGRKGTRGFYVQLESSSTRSGAEQVIGKLKGQGVASVTQYDAGRKAFVVMAGPFKTWGEAVGAQKKLMQEYPTATVVP